MLQAFFVHYPPLNRVILDNFVRPFAELDCPFIVDLEADSDDHLQAIMVDLPGNLSVTLSLNY